jgi:hypothetical protein
MYEKGGGHCNNGDVSLGDVSLGDVVSSDLAQRWNGREKSALTDMGNGK